MNHKIYEFKAVIESVPDKHGAYVRFPYDIRKEFGKGRVKVQAAFDGIPYKGSIVNMGLKILMVLFVTLLVYAKIFRRKCRNTQAIRLQ